MSNGNGRMAGLVYRSMKPGEEEAVANLAERVFSQFVAPDYSDEGVREFLRYAAPDQISQRLQAGHFLLVAEEQGELVGLIEMRHCEHVAMLFVARQGRGVGRELVHRAIARCRRDSSGIARVTVHSAPGAVEIYAHLGFQTAGPEQTENGIRFVPMTLELGSASGEST